MLIKKNMYNIYEPKFFKLCILICISLPHSVIYRFFSTFDNFETIYDAILPKIVIFLENGHYLGIYALK